MFAKGQCLLVFCILNNKKELKKNLSCCHTPFGILERLTINVFLCLKLKNY